MPTASTCLTAAEFHKTDPTLVLAGGFTGELYLWSVARDQDPLVATSNMKGHREKVTGVEWVTATQVLSCALDGRVILWNVDAVAQNFLPARIYLLKAEHLPRSLKVKYPNPRIERDPDAGYLYHIGSRPIKCRGRYHLHGTEQRGQGYFYHGNRAGDNIPRYGKCIIPHDTISGNDAT